SCGTGRRSSTARRPTTIRPRRRGTCTSRRTATRPPSAASSRKPRPRPSSTSVECAREAFRAPATGIYSTTSASRYPRRRGPRPSPTATTSPETTGGMTTPPSRRRRRVPGSAQAPGRSGGGGGGGGPRSEERGRTSGAPAVEPLSRLLSQLPLRHFVAQDLRGLELRLPERLMEVFGDREPDVEADEIRQLERAHRMVVSQLHRLVDVFGGRDPALEHPHRLEAEGQT